jgi:hypothetical protein
MVEQIGITSRRRAVPFTLFLVLLLGVAAPRLAHAGPNDPASKAARAAYEEGQVAFNLGQWDKAIEAWQRGYKAKPDPVFLYNIAQAYRKAGNTEQSIFFYKSYLHNTSNAPNRDEVVSWVDQLEKQAAEERQRKADEEKKKADDAEQRRREEAARLEREEAARRAAQQPVKNDHGLRGDLGLSAGVNLWVNGLRVSRSPSAAVELTGGYTIVEHGRIRFRLGATFGFSYLSDVSDKKVNAFGLMLDPTLKIDLWKSKLFFLVEIGLGANIVAGLPADQTSAMFKRDTTVSDGGAFASFEARPAVGIEYLIIPRLSVLLAPGAVVTTAPNKDFSTLVRVQILAGLSVHL